VGRQGAQSRSKRRSVESPRLVGGNGKNYATEVGTDDLPVLNMFAATDIRSQ